MHTQSVGKVLALFLSQEGTSTRTPVTTLQLDTKGVVGDKFYGKNIQRSVLLTSTHSYELAKAEDITFDYGLLGENILMDYNPYLLDTGTQLTIGTATLQITQYCTMCDHLTAIDPVLPQLLCNDRGIFAKVIVPGEIKRGDTIHLI